MLEPQSTSIGDTLTPTLEHRYSVGQQQISALHLGQMKVLFVDDALIDKRRSTNWRLQLGPRSFLNDGLPIVMGPHPNSSYNAYQQVLDMNEFWGTVRAIIF